MKTIIFGLIAGILCPIVMSAQVADIKKESSKTTQSSSHSDSKSRSRSTSSSDNTSSVGLDAIAMFFGVTVGSIVAWQEYTLKQRKINPAIVSFEAMVHVGSQPSNYYIINPRIRGNWGVFSTDFRFNYLIEEGLDGAETIRTEDWQIIELNIIAIKNVIGRIGVGTLHESFSGGKSFTEWTTSIDVLDNNKKFGAMGEFRWAEPRKEVSVQFQSRLFSAKALHTYATLGVVYQQYYSKIDVWGVQCGLVMRLY